MDTENFLKSADLAMYSAKSEGRGTYRIFDPEMDEVVQAGVLERDMRTALAQGEFELHLPTAGQSADQESYGL